MQTEAAKPLKIFLSVDMEGITDVVKWDETETQGIDYQRYRKIMTEEANAAIRGAFEAGAEVVLVRDAHGCACNLLPEDLDERATLIRGWSGGPLMMMEGIDASFAAAVFIGYHASIGTRNAVLGHTMTSRFYEVRLNDLIIPELGLNAAIAGHFDVAVVFVSGDRALIQQAHELLGPREYVAVKSAIGNAASNIHPKTAQRLIQDGVKKAIEQRDQYLPFKLSPPYSMQIQYVKENEARRAELIPGSKLLDNRTVLFSSPEFFDILKFFYLVTQ